jgi:6-phosphogluconolactonase
MNSFRIDDARVEVWRDLAELSERASELLIGIAREAAFEQSEFTLALSGGSTPKALYELLATDSKRTRIPWSQTHLFWTDERCVPPTDAQSNYRMVHEAMLVKLGLKSEQIHRMHGEDEPQQAAVSYAEELTKHFGDGNPRFSLILLGMGEDAHTASLFPNSPALADTSHTVLSSYVEKLAALRLTMTLKTLNSASTIIFLVSGESKAKALSDVFGRKVDGDRSLPATLVRPSNGELIWLIDEPAATLVSSRF